MKKPPVEIGRSLLEWYSKHRRRLPWREDPTPYSVWVSEVMLQQTRVETVIPYYRRFLERFPRIEDLAAASIDDVLSLWSGLGYYRRARSLHAGAKAVVEQHGGRFPADRADALEVPGVGPYTAGAVLSIAYNLPEPVVDGNVERVLTRLHRIEGNPKQGAVAKRLGNLAREAIPEGHAADFNQALMELGATVCTPRSPTCAECPLEALCLARSRGEEERFPESPPERKTVNVSLHAAIVRDGDRYLLERVTRGSYLRGLWLFPLAEGESGAGEPSPDLVRALHTRHHLTAACEGPCGSMSHSITFRRLRIEAFRFNLAGSTAAAASEDSRWERLEDLGVSVPVSSIALKLAKKLAAGWRGA